ncbi:MAG: family 78 glycoside hydrolase catalytic domain [Candidatus Merdivicinus sp.]|jgi:alpha-L-rhamnosidase
MQNIHWIQGDSRCESPLFRKVFTAVHPISAKLEICGLGFFQLYVNGKQVGNEEFRPAVSTYHSVLGCRVAYPVWEERAAYRTYYLTYDLLPYLREGKNVLGVHLGNGWYHQTRRTAEGEFLFGFPKLRYELTITNADGSRTLLESDPTTLWKESEILENNLFFGETHDLRKICTDWSLPDASEEGWKPSFPSHAPETTLTEQHCPPDRIIRTIFPQKIGENGTTRLYDCGENITGWVNLHCTGASGEMVEIRHSEELSADRNSLDFSSCGGERQIQCDRYLCAEEAHTVHPKFCWHGFRYFTVTGPGEPESVSVIHTDVAVTSSFCCSNSVLNWLYDAYIRTQLDNLHGSIPSDCPHRERLGYTGDGQITAKSVMLTLDAKAMYDKWMQDILDSAGAETGHIPHTAPFLGGGGGPGGWGGAIFVVPMAYYETYGDLSLLRKCYPAILRWLNYMESRTEDSLIVREELGGWCLGDWCAPDKDRPDLPEAFVNTCYYIKGMRTALIAAKLLGESIPDYLTARIEASENALIRHYFDPASESFCCGVNGADAFALEIGLGTDRTARNLIEKYRRTQKLDTGIFGTEILIGQLFGEGEAELAFHLLADETDASFAHMKNCGATTLWETWNGKASHNHPMFGGVIRFLFSEILGIRQKEGSVGYEQVEISPAKISALDWAEGSIQTPHGTIMVHWERRKDGTLAIQQSIIPKE